ncbi:MAG: hypothetical protein CYPHOPRED_003250 [Cyphobasidiales sp. Tagirdzhanova-0007]|nr:MAG: hypothetical protein CYPHOPRED_003250 [Cyphobasidiales sp. Tagirdzhanova-0007]
MKRLYIVSRSVGVDPDTSMPFPSMLDLPRLSSNLELIGLGVRTVSFLRVQVYSVGAYFATEALASLKGKQKPKIGAEEAFIAQMLEMPYDTAIRIVPVKNTAHSHLRDGFVRALLARIQSARKAGQLTLEEEEATGLAVETFKGFFPTGKVPRGKSLLLVRRGRDGALLLEYEGRLLGTLQNDFLSKQLMLAYFANNGKEISPKSASTSVSAPAPPLPSLSNRGLASAVLLSRSQFERRTVKQLQEELGGRGLSTKGKKSQLVDRLLESVSKGPPPRSPSVASASTGPSTSGSSGPSRSISTSAVTSATVQSESVITHTPSPIAAGSAPPSELDPAATGHGDGQSITAAPGLIVDKDEQEILAQAAEEAPGGTIEMPNAIFMPGLDTAIEEYEMMIPTSPDMYKYPENNGKPT